MTVEEVEGAICKVRQVMNEWEEVDREHYPGETGWLETHTRYAFVDPIIRALGWDTGNPKECHPEYYRPYRLSKRVDYAMFGKVNPGAIGKWEAKPKILVEAKAVGTKLSPRHLDQLNRYARASPEMTEGVAVLTNGEEWHLYKIEGQKHLKNDQVQKATVYIRGGDSRQAAETLHSWLHNKQSN